MVEVTRFLHVYGLSEISDTNAFTEIQDVGGCSDIFISFRGDHLVRNAVEAEFPVLVDIKSPLFARFRERYR